MTSPLDTKSEELIAIGAALAANCEPCLRYHVRRGAEAGCTQDEMRRAIHIAQGVKDTPARLLANLADRLLGSSPAQPGPEGPCDALAAETVGVSSGPCCTSATSDSEEYDRGSPVGKR
ncbi:MAG: carboxymuconolactone decarboxylase family protein [Candidatus Rokubacteria bacterium]|nr:carboxymuconolactone decarboxylase family protein [Candidatus Rokubacteria bacterium]